MTEDEKYNAHTIIHAHAVAAGARNAIPVPGLEVAADIITITRALSGGSIP